MFVKSYQPCCALVHKKKNTNSVFFSQLARLQHNKKVKFSVTSSSACGFSIFNNNPFNVEYGNFLNTVKLILILEFYKMQTDP